MSDSSRISNIQVAVITVITAIYAGVTLPSLGKWTASERRYSGNTSELSQHSNRPETAVRAPEASGGFDTAFFVRVRGSGQSSQPTPAEIAR